MSETIRLGAIAIALIRKPVKHTHLTVHPPAGTVTLVTPLATRSEVARAYAISRLGWIRQQQAALRAQAREAPRRYVERESHYVWGRRYLLQVRELDAKPGLRLDHRRITLTVRPGASEHKRAEVMHDWHKALLHEAAQDSIARWAPRLGVPAPRYFLQRMKTRWGSCNPATGTIRLNTELVKKPRELLDYVVVHELLHLIEPTHGERFIGLLDQHFPAWREARMELNDLPLGADRRKGYH